MQKPSKRQSKPNLLFRTPSYPWGSLIGINIFDSVIVRKLSCLIIKVNKQARDELGQAQGTQSSYPFLYGGWLDGIVKLVVQLVAIDCRCKTIFRFI